MPKNCLHILLLFCSLAMGQISPQSKEITQKFFPDVDSLRAITPALKKEKGFTNYEELVSFLESLVTKYPEKTTLKYIGESQKGLKIPMLVLKSNNTVEPLKVWMQGGLHGDEPASTEGLLYLMNDLLENPKHRYLFEKIELAIVPMANIDGYLKLERNAANGIDLNRDQTKLMAIETVVLKKALHEFNPQVALDFHEYRPYRKDFTKFGSFGVTGAYDVMFLYSGNLNVPQNIRTFTQEYFVNNAKKRMDTYNFKHADYFTTNTYDGAIQFDQGSTSPRSSATSFALQNKISTLIEVRGVGINKTSFKRRIFITQSIGLSYLETTYNEIEKIKSEINFAQIQNNDVVVTSKKAIYKDTLDFIDLDSNSIIPIEVTLRNAWKLQPLSTRKRPKGYLLDVNQAALVEKIKVLGYEVVVLDAPTTYLVEKFSIVKYDRDTEKYEKMNPQAIESKLVEENKTFAAGTFYIDMNQKGSSLLLEILEPELPSSFVGFGVLKTEINDVLPIYRHIY